MKKIKEILFLFIVLTLLSSYVVANEIEPNPSQFSINLTAGCSAQRNITISNIGDDLCLCNITTEVLPDSIGISISYDPPPPFQILPNSDYTIVMTINTSMLLLPQTYIITTYFDCQFSPPKKESNGYYYPSGHTLPYEQPESPVTPPPEQPDTNPPYVPDYTYKVTEQSIVFYPYLIAIILIILLITLFYVYSKRKGEK